MKEEEGRQFMRPTIQVGVALLGAAIILAPHTGRAQLTRISQIIDEPSPLLHSGAPAQGYLGVLVADIDNDSASKLKLKDARGAVVTLIDHDAPAAQVGLRVNDVLLEVNGQPVEGAEAFGRMMREIPPGRKIAMVVSRDGATQTMTVQLVDRKKLDTDIWNKLNSGSDISSPVTGLGIFGSGAGGDAPLPGGFHMPFVGNSSLKVGALVEPLTAQMADYLGIGNGLMVKQVARKSQAAAAGMKAFDVILRVGTDNIATVSDWDRAMRANQGKTVAVTILRDKRQQTVNLLVDSKKKGEVEFDRPFDQEGPLMAFAHPDPALSLFADQVAAEEMREQAEQFRDAFNHQELDVQNLGPDFDPKTLGMDMERMGELERQIQQDHRSDWPNFEERQRKQMQQEMDQLKRQMEELQALGFDHLV
jgi:serine protease Do